MSSKYKNIVVFVADSLRYDSVPESLSQGNTVIPTLTPSLHSPTSFASLFTARNARNHTVHNFLEDLDPSIPTAFDYFEHSSFYDGDISSINKHIYKSGGKDLTEMEEPFIWIERMMDTHLPYGRARHERDYEFELSGREYIEKEKKVR